MQTSVKEIVRLSVAAALLMTGWSGASAQTQGDWVLARYKQGAHWYPGIVARLGGDQVVVAYDDGDKETLSLRDVRPYDWAIGRRVECNFQGAGKWFPGVIASLSGETIGINYDDGDRERTKTGRCRSR